MLSWRVKVTCVMVTVACVASVGRDSPRTLALERKSESHSAFSPERRGGISAGGLAGSNVWVTRTIGCLEIVEPEFSLRWRGEEKLRHTRQPAIRPASNTQNTITPRNGNAASVFYSLNKRALEP